MVNLTVNMCKYRIITWMLWVERYLFTIFNNLKNLWDLKNWCFPSVNQHIKLGKMILHYTDQLFRDVCF